MATSTVNSIDLPAEFDSPMHTIFLFRLSDSLSESFTESLGACSSGG
jgi:hypothetical protein